MKRLVLTAISCTLLIPAGAMAEDTSSIFVPVCADWRSSATIDQEALDRLRKNSVNERPASGLSQTKNQFIVLLGKNPTAAKDTLANFKDKLPKTSNGKVDLRDAQLKGFNLSGMNLDNADLSSADLSGADLSGASLRNASLYKAELEGANLSNTNLSFANAEKASFSNASLCQSTLTSAELENAVFLGAYVKGAKFDMAKHIPKAIYLNAESVLHFGLPVPEDN